MGIFDNVKSAASSAASKTKNLAETTKLSLSINSKEGDIKEIYNKIGEAFYLCCREGAEGELEVLCEKIDTLKNEIAEIRTKILKIKNISLCPVCNAENTAESKFCAKCGASLPVVAPEEAPAEATAETALCANCQAPLAPGAVFCGSCGFKNA
ncbi:MAG: zinc ribbon domain-containing protein [Clostridiales bacterium]|nr:zinc ribbon domain-containing protein [Clostridiales bacterium]